MQENPARGVQDVRAFVKPYGIDVVEREADTSTAALAAAAIGTTVPTIVKSLLFYAGGEPIVVLATGDRKVNARKLAREIGRGKVRMATPDEVRLVTGYAIGGVPPVAHVENVPRFMDRNLLEYPTVYASAGTSSAIFAVAPELLRELAGATLIDAVE